MLILALILLVVTAILLGLGIYRSSSRYAVEQRLEQIREAEDQTVEEELSKPFVQRMLLPIGSTFASMFRRYTPAEVTDRTHRKLVMAGLFPRVTASHLLGLCWLSALGCFLLMVMLLITLAQGSGATVHYDDPLNILFLALGALTATDAD